MAKHTVVTMPGDGIGNQVFPRHSRSRKPSSSMPTTFMPTSVGTAGVEKAMPCRERTIELLAEAQAGTLWRHHLQAQEAGRSRTRARTARQRATRISARSSPCGSGSISTSAFVRAFRFPAIR